MTREARLAQTPTGAVPMGDGWFVLNARAARWLHAPGRSAICEWEGQQEGEAHFSQLGVNLSVLAPGESMGMYHREADQEDFLVLSGEGLLIVEGDERRLGAWDLVHCPAGTGHIIVGAGDGPCVVLAVGARDRSVGENWGVYTVDPAAVRHGVGVSEETTDSAEAYAGLTRRRPVSFDPRWLP